MRAFIYVHGCGHNAPVFQVVALGREVLGGNGILAEFGAAKQFCDMEAIYTYEVRLHPPL
jgi:hypothetical protein